MKLSAIKWRPRLLQKLKEGTWRTTSEAVSLQTGCRLAIPHAVAVGASAHRRCASNATGRSSKTENPQNGVTGLVTDELSGTGTPWWMPANVATFAKLQGSFGEYSTLDSTAPAWIPTVAVGGSTNTAVYGAYEENQ